jgi:hypothetical protein
MKYAQHSFYALLMFMLLGLVTAQAADRYKPFVLGSVSTGDLNAKVSEVKGALVSQGFKVIGEYEPYADTRIVIVTNNDLLKIAAANKRGGYAAVQNVSIVKTGGKVQVSYPNPIYFQYAYRLKGSLEPVAQKLKNALGAQETFGSKKGLTAKKLKKYHYTFGMEYYDDPYKFKTYKNHGEAVKAVSSGLSAGKGGLGEIYRLDIPGTNMTLFGVSMKAGKDGNKYMDDAFQMGIIDFADMKHAAYLPYTILVNDKQVEALNMRFRAAVHFPDLKMAGKNSFMKVMKSPGAIEGSMWELFGGKPKEKKGSDDFFTM